MDRRNIVAGSAPHLKDAAASVNPAIEQEPPEHFRVHPTVPAVLTRDRIVVYGAHHLKPCCSFPPRGADGMFRPDSPS